MCSDPGRQSTPRSVAVCWGLIGGDGGPLLFQLGQRLEHHRGGDGQAGAVLRAAPSPVVTATLIPITRAYSSASGPPELPWVRGTLLRMRTLSSGRLLLRTLSSTAVTCPTVTGCSRLAAAPMATASPPTSTSSRSETRVATGSPVSSTSRKARSYPGARPTNLARSQVPSSSRISILSAGRRALSVRVPRFAAQRDDVVVGHHHAVGPHDHPRTQADLLQQRAPGGAGPHLHYGWTQYRHHRLHSRVVGDGRRRVGGEPVDERATAGYSRQGQEQEQEDPDGRAAVSSCARGVYVAARSGGRRPGPGTPESSWRAVG